jgi:glycosyltransferase involved in cell wall biosynthesis
LSSAPPTVLYVHSSSGHYGADRQLLLIAGGLDRSRYRPLVVIPGEGGLASDLRAAGVEVLVRPLSVVRRELASARGAASIAGAIARDALRLGALVKQRPASLVHSNTSVVLGGAAAAAVGGVPHIWHVREIYSRYGRLWPRYRSLLGTAAALPCVSAATAAQFRGSDPVRVIHDGLALEPARAERGVARRALGLGNNEPAIAVLGRISDWKGQDVLVRALAEPPLRDRSAVALIAGEAWPGAEARTAKVLELARTLGVEDRVRMLGFREDVGTVLGAADVVAVPSSAPDPLPGAAIEAAAAGCAVLASAHGGLPEIIRDGETGRLVAPGDPAALARVAAELLDQPELRERLGAAASADVRERFSAARLLGSIQELYDSLLAARPARGSARSA